MDNIEIKAKLNELYSEYKSSKNSLSSGKAKTAAKLTAEIITNGGNPRDAAAELARFPSEVSVNFFGTLRAIPWQTAENLLMELQAADNDPKLSQYYVPKFAAAAAFAMKNYKNEACQSAALPSMVEFMAGFAVKSAKNKNKFSSLITDSEGGIFALDYSSASKKSLTDIWNLVNEFYPDLPQSPYENLIAEWGKKYGFIKGEIAEKSVKQNDNVLYEKIKTDIDRGQEAIIAAINAAFKSVRGEIANAHKTPVQSVPQNENNADLERRLSEAKAENEELKNKVAELDKKLTFAYSINSREASLEAERIRSNLSKEFTFLYEDWLEYESSTDSADNCTTLKAIIKKIFRALERNGINFKGNNQ